MAAEFEEKVALVTGAGSGIGRATALTFASAGARVVVADLSIDTADETVASIKEAGGDAASVEVDVSKAADAERMVQVALDTFGGLDCAFNNAGVVGQQLRIADVSEEEWDFVYAVNAKGVWLSMKYEIPALLARGGGAIVNASSVLGVVGSAFGGVYSSTKHAVAGMTRCAALDYATDGIRVNATSPGMIKTPMMLQAAEDGQHTFEAFEDLHPVRRMGTVEEVAATVLWLCSDAASFITGLVMPVDGGYSAR